MGKVFLSGEASQIRSLSSALFAGIQLDWTTTTDKLLGLATCPSHKHGGIPSSALPKDIINKLASLFSRLTRLYWAPSREAANTIFQSIGLTRLEKWTPYLSTAKRTLQLLHHRAGCDRVVKRRHLDIHQWQSALLVSMLPRKRKSKNYRRKCKGVATDTCMYLVAEITISWPPVGAGVGIFDGLEVCSALIARRILFRWPSGPVRRNKYLWSQSNGEGVFNSLKTLISEYESCKVTLSDSHLRVPLQTAQVITWTPNVSFNAKHLFRSVMQHARQS